MYEGMKKQVIAKVTKQIDKEVSDSRSDIMGLCLKKNDFKLNEYLDSLFFNYFEPLVYIISYLFAIPTS